VGLSSPAASLGKVATNVCYAFASGFSTALRQEVACSLGLQVIELLYAEHGL